MTNSDAVIVIGLLASWHSRFFSGEYHVFCVNRVCDLTFNFDLICRLGMFCCFFKNQYECHMDFCNELCLAGWLACVAKT